MNFTITKKDFSSIHNAKCDLFLALENLDGVLSEKMLQSLQKALEELDKGLASVYEQEDKIIKQLQQLHNEISYKHKLCSCWSINDVSDLSEIPFPTAKTMSYKGNTLDIDNASWEQLWVVADKLIRMSGDDHHIFIEDFRLKGGDLQLSTGS